MNPIRWGFLECRNALCNLVEWISDFWNLSTSATHRRKSAASWGAPKWCHRYSFSGHMRLRQELRYWCHIASWLPFQNLHSQIWHFLSHKTKLAVASSDKRNPRQCEELFIAAIHFFALNVSGSSFCWLVQLLLGNAIYPLNVGWKSKIHAKNLRNFVYYCAVSNELFLRKKWMVNLSGAGKILWAQTWKKIRILIWFAWQFQAWSYFPFLLVAGRYLQGHVS